MSTEERTRQGSIEMLDAPISVAVAGGAVRDSSSPFTVAGPVSATPAAKGPEVKPAVEVIVVPAADAESPSLCSRVMHCMRAPFQPGFSWRDTASTYLTFYRLHFFYFSTLSLVGGLAIYLIEEGNHAYIDTLYMAGSCATVTGLTTLDTPALQRASQIILLVLMFLGGNVFMAVAPVIIRRRYFIQYVAAKFDDESTRERALESQVEYKALTWIIRICVGYAVLAQLTGFFILGLYFQLAGEGKDFAALAGVNPWYLAIYVAMPAFNNAGISLFSSSYAPFASNYLVLIVMACLSVMGNTGAPVFIRLIVYALHHTWKEDASLKFLLDKPRRCFTHMFSDKDTRTLAIVLAVFTLFQYTLFMALDFHLPILEPYPGHVRSLMAFFQSNSTRTGGFTVMDLSLVSPAMQLVYALMMYVAVYPFLLVVSRSSSPTKKAGAVDPVAAGALRDTRRNSLSDNCSPTAPHRRASFERSARTEAFRKMAADGTLSAIRHRNVSAHFDGGHPPATHMPSGMSAEGMVADGSIGRASAATYYSHDLQELAPEPPPPKTSAQLASSVASRELFWLFLALLVMCIADGHRMMDDPHPRSLSIFGLLFELSSAFGTVGLSLGYPGSPVSLSGQLSVISKLIIIFTMLFGRHRGLPSSIDSAVYLPSLLNSAVNGPTSGVDPLANIPNLTSITSVMNTLTTHRNTVGIRHRMPSFRAMRDVFPAAGVGMADASTGAAPGRLVRGDSMIRLEVDRSQFNGQDKEMPIAPDPAFLQLMQQQQKKQGDVSAAPAAASSASPVPLADRLEFGDEIIHRRGSDDLAASDCAAVPASLAESVQVVRHANGCSDS